MTAQLDHPFPEPPPHGQPLSVAPGIRWLRLPLPFALDHINLWLLEDGDGWTVVDTGFADDTSRGLWQQVFAGGLEGRPIRRILCTHFHPDHMGLASWLAERWQAPFLATLGEWLYGRSLALDTSTAFVDTQVEFYRRAGFDDELQELTRRRGNVYRGRVMPLPQTLHRIEHGQALTIGGRSWRVMVGTGHSPEHAALWCAEAGILISGDQILPRISPIIGVWPQEPAADPLAQFLASLEPFRALPAETLVLPSHGLPFRGLPARLEQLAHHHDDRLARTLEACATPATGLEVLRRLFTRRLDDHQVFFAIGESLAHLHYLENRGDLVRSTRGDGVWLFGRP